MTIVHRHGLAMLLAVLGALGGCSGPLTDDEFLHRLSRDGIPRPDLHASAPSRRAADPAPTLPGRDIALTDLLRRADEANPDIRAARASVGAAAGGAWQAGLYPNPTANVTTGEIGFEGDSSNTIVGITQPIVIGSRLRAAVAAADAEQAARLADVERVRREVLGRVVELHARVQELAAQLVLIDELLGIGEKTLSIAEARFEARAVAEPDVIRPRVEVYQLRSDRRRIARELAVAERQLGLILDLEPIAADRLTGGDLTDPAPLDERSLVAAVETGHPALLIADRRIDAAAATLERIRAERIPDLNVTAGVGYSEEGDQGIAELGVGAEIPIWNRRQGDIMTARFELMQRRQERAARRNDLLARLAEELGAYNAACDQLVILRDRVVPESQRAFDQIDEAYRAGRASFIDLLDAQRTLMQSRRTLIELTGDASVARARVAAIAGTHLLTRPGDSEQLEHHTPPKPAPEGAEETQ